MTSPHRQETFSRRVRLTKRSEFLAAQERGRRLPGTSYLLFALPAAAPAAGRGVRLGITVSKKVGNAVTRNRVKRWVRESYRRMPNEVHGSVDLVVIARPSAATGSYQKTATELQALLRRLPR